MSANTLTLVPAGGLGNRMYAVASACYLCRQTDTHLRVLWFKDWALGAAFGQIFQDPCQPDIHITEARLLHHLTADRPRLRNLWLPRLPQYFLYQQRLDEQEVQRRLHQHFDFAAWIRDKNSWMSNYLLLCPEARSLVPELFHPVPQVMQDVEANTAHFGPHTFGFHIRRTDHVVATQASPTDLFIRQAKELIDEYHDCTIYLATDSHEVKQQLVHLFGPHIITSPADAVRGNVEGIRQALVEMYTLAETHTIYGSHRSSFSQVASIIGAIPLQPLTLEPLNP